VPQESSPALEAEGQPTSVQSVRLEHRPGLLEFLRLVPRTRAA